MYLYPSLRTLLVWALLLLSWLLRAAAGPTGHWEGRIDLGNNGLPVIVDLVRNAAPGPATFKGTFSEDATRLAGTVSNAVGRHGRFRRSIAARFEPPARSPANGNRAASSCR